MMGECIQNSAIVQNEMELYLTVAKFKKPVKIKPLAPNAGPERILEEMECRALISPPGASQCQCCVGEFFPSYPFVVEEV